MVFKKRLDYGFNTFNVPSVPRAPRSNRRCRSKQLVEDSRICAFELLATLARKLLQESESSASSNASEGHNRAAASESTTENSDIVKEFKPAKGDRNLCSPLPMDLCDGKSENGFKQEPDAKGLDIGKSGIANTCPLKDPVESPMTFPAAISKGDVNLPSRRDPVPNASFPRHRNDIKLVSRDDDENFSRFNRLNYRFKTSRRPIRIGERRIRKLLTSKYWKVAPKLKDFEQSKADGGMKPRYRKRKTYYNYDRYQYDTLYKRRKFFDRSSIVTSDDGISSESVCNSPEKPVDGDKGGSASMSHEVCGIPPLLTSNKASHQSKDSHGMISFRQIVVVIAGVCILVSGNVLSEGCSCTVKFSIKSFRIPELYIEVPESATVGSLKRTVMEAVTALLGGGIRVGVLLQGKKVRDDNRTLSQSGISCEDNLDSLGFTLEPGPAKAPPPMCSEEPPLPISCDIAPQHLTSFPATPVVDTKIPDATPSPLLLTNSAHPMDTNIDPVTSQTDMLTDQSLSESRAIVPVSAMNVESLAVIPAIPKARKSEPVQRRTRRPFSVLEVEALVQAVEELGTGRWRDIKLRAFENADHRTYVDLKDKWKTLVHTAKISPQQRRGEPVPQELLDRVLAAHAYWSQHQAKQQAKHQPGAFRITDVETDRNGVATTIPTVSM